MIRIRNTAAGIAELPGWLLLHALQLVHLLLAAVAHAQCARVILKEEKNVVVTPFSHTGGGIKRYFA